jgi:hypothetical protein
MKINLFINFLLLSAFMSAICVDSKAQVTIGSSLAPQEGALLEFKEKEISSSDSTTATKGVLLPKVKLVAYDDLSPLFATTEEPQKTTSKGMIVYNINSEAVGLETGLYVWDSMKWVPVMDGKDLSGGETNTIDYTFRCESVDVSQTYLKENTVSTGSIIIRITVPDSAAGNPYRIETDEVNGVKYVGEGTLVAGTYFVSLDSNGGIPQKSGRFTYKITSNSTDPYMSGCSVEIPVTGRAINVLIYGQDNNGKWDLIGKNQDHGVSLILQNSTFFGLDRNFNSYCPVEQINVTQSNTASSPKALFGYDIIIISYPFNIPGPILRDSLIDFVRKEGVLIACLDDSDFSKATNELNQTLFGGSISTTSTKTNMFALQGGNPYVNGYWNLSGKKIGRDGDGNVSLNLSTTAAVNTEILAVDNDSYPVVIKHKTLPYFLFGDGGTFCGGKKGFNNDNDYSPLLVSGNGMPLTRTSKDYKDTYNAHFFTNIIMWAINHRLSR